MTYVQALVYDLEGNFRGYTTLNHEANKLKSTNLWSEAELPKLQEQLDRLNVGSELMAHWPSLNDPQVAALLNNPAWEPLEMEWADVVDEERSHYVFEQVPEIDLATGRETGRLVNGNIDEQASVIVLKKAQVPKEPVKAQLRIKKAQETVARQRAGR